MSSRPKLPIYAKAPMTRRTGEYFALAGGFDSVSDLADSLPEGARVVDIGAGKSQFGARVCRRREDVDWTNVDIRYHISEVTEKLQRAAPPNLRFVPADVLDLGSTLDSGQFDRVYSYFLMPHMNMAGRPVARRAARNMLEVAHPEGEVAVGPGKDCHNVLFQIDMVDVDATELDEMAVAMAEATRWSLGGRMMQYASNCLFSRLEKDMAVAPQHLAYAD